MQVVKVIWLHLKIYGLQVENTEYLLIKQLWYLLQGHDEIMFAQLWWRQDLGERVHLCIYNQTITITYTEQSWLESHGKWLKRHSRSAYIGRD